MFFEGVSPNSHRKLDPPTDLYWSIIKFEKNKDNLGSFSQIQMYSILTDSETMTFLFWGFTYNFSEKGDVYKLSLLGKVKSDDRPELVYPIFCFKFMGHFLKYVGEIYHI